MTQPKLTQQITDLTTTVTNLEKATNSNLGQQNDDIKEMAKAFGILDGVVKSQTAEIAKKSTVDLTPVATELSKIGDGFLTKLEERLPTSEVLTKLQTSLDETNDRLDKAGDVLIRMDANLTNKKIVEVDGVKTLADKGFFDHAVDYGKPVAMTAAGVVVGIGIWEGGRAAYDWATSDAHPVDL